MASGPLAKRPPHIAFDLLSCVILSSCPGKLPMKRLSVPSAALLYAALAAFANPAGAQVLDADRRAEIEALKTGEMRKLVVHAEPVAVEQVVFTDLSGTEFTLAETDGKLRLVNFWATWCAPCRTEKPSLDALQRGMGGDDFEVIAIATGRNDPAAIERFNAEVGVTALDTNLDPRSALARAMNIPGLPVTVVMNREGQEIARLMGGADWDSESARAIMALLLAAGDGS
jgi:thiol-disulfide isomerase/thioredoxin